MNDARLFFGGIPTAPDVKKLEDRFGILKAGTLISHAELSSCIGVPWKSTRYRSVVESWRKKLMREHNIDTGAEPSVGIRILTGPERIAASEADFGSAVKKTRKAVKRIVPIPDEGLSEIEKKTRDHVRMIACRSYMVMATERRAIRGTTAPEAMPRKSAAG